ncbi:DUF6286 domain-containing protein [Acidiferrimicrobium sp. IK]|uniref:DUF6286 domain-containing protein n=1 Tax=Acidiferrimicrobium sp. IK TaxID=2871700 RepID=UPI0021CB8C0C|nr:DUF6286 domain-containing protein [Acidiferrimicrobium sp. IK]MCU4186010.1 DUF6286 domain-containing protein [Acidiferrimicrobium sp. IK]
MALLLGLGVAGAAVIAGIETMLLVLGEPSLVVPRSDWARTLSSLRWNDTALAVVAGGVAAGGALLLLVQVIPRKPVRLLLRSGAHAGTWLSRKGLGRKVAYDVAALAQVSRSSARVGRRRVRVQARLEPGIEAAAGKAAVLGAATSALEQWPLVVPLRVTARVRTTRLPTTPGERPLEQRAAISGPARAS